MSLAGNNFHRVSLSFPFPTSLLVPTILPGAASAAYSPIESDAPSMTQDHVHERTKSLSGVTVDVTVGVAANPCTFEDSVVATISFPAPPLQSPLHRVRRGSHGQLLLLPSPDEARVSQPAAIAKNERDCCQELTGHTAEHVTAPHRVFSLPSSLHGVKRGVGGRLVFVGPTNAARSMPSRGLGATPGDIDSKYAVPKYSGSIGPKAPVIAANDADGNLSGVNGSILTRTALLPPQSLCQARSIEPTPSLPLRAAQAMLFMTSQHVSLSAAQSTEVAPQQWQLGAVPLGMTSNCVASQDLVGRVSGQQLQLMFSWDNAGDCVVGLGMGSVPCIVAE